MARPRNRPVTWIEVAVKNAGMRKGTTAMAWAYLWSVTREALGHEPTVDEVAEYWAMNRRKAFRDQAAFREAFPMLETPAQIYASPEVRESLRDLIETVDNVIDKKHKLTTELGAIRMGALPANL